MQFVYFPSDVRSQLTCLSCKICDAEAVMRASLLLRLVPGPQKGPFKEFLCKTYVCIRVWNAVMILWQLARHSFGCD